MTRLAVLFVLLAAGLAGCGDSGSGRGGLKVTATTTQVADVVMNVGGSRVALTRILNPNSDPHEYEPRPSDARAVAEATLIFRSGGDVDDWLRGLLSDAGGHARTIDLSRSVRTVAGDPHWWQDASNGVAAVAAVRDALVRADPAGRALYVRNAAAYAARLRRLDRSISACIGELPKGERKLVTSHDAFGYYARRYGLTIVGALIPSLSTQAQPSARDTERLVHQIERERVKSIFPESSLNPKLEKAVARETGARVGGSLWADSLGPKGSSGATYAGSLRANTAAIVSGLSGGRLGCRPRA
jgi:ABC-type Zn uptake system ZnuABC Zn-binding protein ZnuA